MIDARDGRVLLADGVALGPHFNAAALRTSPLRFTLQPLAANAPFHTFVGRATLADGVPVGITLVFCDFVLAHISMRFGYEGGVDEQLVHDQHTQWLARTLGEGPYVYDWGCVDAMVHPRDAEASISVTWRGVSALYDGAIPPLPTKAS